MISLVAFGAIAAVVLVVLVAVNVRVARRNRNMNRRERRNPMQPGTSELPDGSPRADTSNHSGIEAPVAYRANREPESRPAADHGYREALRQFRSVPARNERKNEKSMSDNDYREAIRRMKSDVPKGIEEPVKDEKTD